MKISNTMIDQLFNDERTKKIKILCTKCKGSNFEDRDDLRKHYKTNWHTFNAKLSAHGKESFSAEDFDEYSLMHPDVLK